MALTVKALVVGGGGGANGGVASVRYGDGAGGGRVVYRSAYAVTAGTTYTVTVGNGGAGVIGGTGATGYSSVFNDLTATGGVGSPSSASVGGSSGKDVDGVTTNYTGGTGTGANPGGGGAGAGANGSDINGGAGYTCSITGSPANYAGGGAGANNGGSGTHVDGGGAGFNPTNGTANTGGGGGGGNSGAAGGTGGSGIVIISWVTANFPSVTITGTGNTKTVSGSETYAKFIVSGTITFDFFYNSNFFYFFNNY